MAATQVVEFITLVFKPSLTPPDAAPPAAFSEFLAQLPSPNDGLVARHLGRQLEDPSRWTLALRWSSPHAHAAFARSASSTAAHAALRAVTDLALSTGPVDMRRRPDLALAAPCTELLSIFRVDDGFLDASLKPFLDIVHAASLQGYHASAYGSFHQPDGDSFPPGDAVLGILGWDSKEVHLSHRGDGKREFLPPTPLPPNTQRA